jgi:hypothetical protein
MGSVCHHSGVCCQLCEYSCPRCETTYIACPDTEEIRAACIKIRESWSPYMLGLHGEGLDELEIPRVYEPSDGMRRNNKGGND